MKSLCRIGTLATLVLTLGCSGNSTPTRDVSGQITLSAYKVGHPVVIAQSNAGRQFVSQVSPTGSFKITLPAGGSYRLSLVDQTAKGTYAAVSRIHWPVATRARWLKMSAGGSIKLGSVHPMVPGASGLGTKAATGDTMDGTDTGGDTQDGAGDVTQCGAQDEMSGENTTDTADNCEDDSAEVCDQADENDSEGDAADAGGGVADDDANETEMEGADATCGGTGGTGGTPTPTAG